MDRQADVEAIEAHLLRYYGSHERPAAIFDLWCWGRTTAPQNPDVEFEADLVDILDPLVADAWIWRNEKMPGNLPAEDWCELFDNCTWPLGDRGDRGEVPTVPFTAYRSGHPDGMSWTTDIAIAQRFAAKGTPLYRCRVEEPLDVLGIFHDRGESEVVLRPDGAWRSTVVTLVAGHDLDEVR